jgi:superfamily II DNA helicase RecQ
VTPSVPTPAARGSTPETVRGASHDLVEDLKSWRLARSRTDDVSAFVVLHDATLELIVEVLPASEAEFAAIRGIGPHKLRRYGSEILEIVSRYR